MKILFSSISVIMLILLSCGGGVIVTGVISGLVVDQNGHPVSGAKVVLAKKGGTSLGDTAVELGSDDLIVKIIPIWFDTVFTNASGIFEYDTIQSGEYTIVSTDGNLIGMEYVSVKEYFYDTVKIMLDYPSVLTVKPYTKECPDSRKFTKAQIAGTDIVENADSNGIFNFRMIPNGDLELALMHKDTKVEKVKNILITRNGLDHSRINTLENPTVLVDPTRSPEYWTVIDCYSEYNDRPYVSWFVPFKNTQGEMVVAGNDDPYDVAIQFSQSMNSRITKSAISISSSDSSTVIDSLWWDAGDMAYISLCTRYGNNECVRGDSLYKEHVTYTVTIDTSAQSTAGVHFAYPEKISFTPKP